VYLSRGKTVYAAALQVQPQDTRPPAKKFIELHKNQERNTGSILLVKCLIST